MYVTLYLLVFDGRRWRHQDQRIVGDFVESLGICANAVRIYVADAMVCDVTLVRVNGKGTKVACVGTQSCLAFISGRSATRILRSVGPHQMHRHVTRGHVDEVPYRVLIRRQRLAIGSLTLDPGDLPKADKFALLLCQLR